MAAGEGEPVSGCILAPPCDWQGVQLQAQDEGGEGSGRGGDNTHGTQQGRTPGGNMLTSNYL